MSKEDDIKRLLITTVQNHHQYQESHLSGKYNSQWSTWYAEFLLEHDLIKVWGKEVTQEELAQALNQLDKDYNDEKPDESWPTYYAKKMAAMAD